MKFMVSVLLSLALFHVCAGVNVQIFSLTGHGSSSMANLLAKEWDIGNRFEVHDGVIVSSTSLESATNGDLTIINAKGFGCRDGPNSDEASLTEVVLTAKQAGSLDAFLLVVNGEDLSLSTLKHLVTMYVNTFGLSMVDRLGIVVTRSYLNDGIAAIKEELTAMLSEVTGRPIKDVPIWAIEIHADRLVARSVSPAEIQKALDNRPAVAVKIKTWLQGLPSPLDMTNVVPAPHPLNQKIVVAGEKLQLAQVNHDKKLMTVRQKEKEDLLHAAEAVWVYAKAKKFEGEQKNQVIGESSGILSWFECVVLMNSFAVVKPWLFPNARDDVDNPIMYKSTEKEYLTRF